MTATATENIIDNEMTARRHTTQVVTFTLAHEEYAVDILKVKEIILVEGITKVPQMPEYIEGIINLRGLIVPVIDLRKRLQLPVPHHDEHTRIMIARMGKRVVGLIVDTVSRVMRIPKNDISEPPETIAGLVGKYLVGVARVNERMIMLLDVEKIISLEELSQLKVA